MQNFNIIALIENAGLAIIPILGLSVLALAVTFERLVHCRKARIVPDDFAASIAQSWRSGEFAAIAEQARTNDSCLARIAAYLVAHRHAGMAALSAGAEDIASVEMRTHLQRIYPLAVAATLSPIIGLLGTVLGMIEAFHAIAFSGAMGDPALLAAGISKALVNTAAGLSVALPSLALHHFFKYRITWLGLTLERQVNFLLQACFPLPGEAAHAR